MNRIEEEAAGKFTAEQATSRTEFGGGEPWGTQTCEQVSTTGPEAPSGTGRGEAGRAESPSPRGCSGLLR